METEYLTFPELDEYEELVRSKNFIRTTDYPRYKDKWYVYIGGDMKLFRGYFNTKSDAIMFKNAVKKHFQGSDPVLLLGSDVNREDTGPGGRYECPPM